jgi:hypothetical protein
MANNFTKASSPDKNAETHVGRLKVGERQYNDAVTDAVASLSENILWNMSEWAGISEDTKN